MHLEAFTFGRRGKRAFSMGGHGYSSVHLKGIPLERYPQLCEELRNTFPKIHFRKYEDPYQKIEHKDLEVLEGERNEKFINLCFFIYYRHYFGGPYNKEHGKNAMKLYRIIKKYGYFIYGMATRQLNCMGQLWILDHWKPYDDAYAPRIRELGFPGELYYMDERTATTDHAFEEAYPETAKRVKDYFKD